MESIRRELCKVIFLFVVFSTLSVFFVKSGNSDSGGSSIKSRSVPFEVKMAVSLEYDFDLYEITKITGRKTKTLPVGSEMWNGTFIVKLGSSNKTFNYAVYVE